MKLLKDWKAGLYYDLAELGVYKKDYLGYVSDSSSEDFQRTQLKEVELKARADDVIISNNGSYYKVTPTEIENVELEQFLSVRKTNCLQRIDNNIEFISRVLKVFIALFAVSLCTNAIFIFWFIGKMLN